MVCFDTHLIYYVSPFLTIWYHHLKNTFKLWGFDMTIEMLFFYYHINIYHVKKRDRTLQGLCICSTDFAYIEVVNDFSPPVSGFFLSIMQLQGLGKLQKYHHALRHFFHIWHLRSWNILKRTNSAPLIWWKLFVLNISHAALHQIQLNRPNYAVDCHNNNVVNCSCNKT